MTELLHMKDNYAKACESRVVASKGDYVVLERSCFYPEGGGQPSDTGTIAYGNGGGTKKEARVLKVSKESGIVKHYVSEPIPAGCIVHCAIDWDKRYRYMRMHTAEHLLTSIVLDAYGGEVAGNQIGFETSRIDYRPFRATPEAMADITQRFNALVDAAKAVTIEQTTREDMMERVDEKRRKMFERLPASITNVRLVIIDGADVDPCAGTHVANTKEIGHINVLKTENKGSDTVRLVFGLL